jgi:hypothetical protein
MELRESNGLITGMNHLGGEMMMQKPLTGKAETQKFSFINKKNKISIKNMSLLYPNNGIKKTVRKTKSGRINHFSLSSNLQTFSTLKWVNSVFFLINPQMVSKTESTFLRLKVNQDINSDVN